MRESGVDRRVKYTKKMLKDVLVEMMKEQHISRISVKVLCEAADVNRSTFYAHYKDPYDLLNQIEQEVLENLKGYLAEENLEDKLPLSSQALIVILEYVKKNADLCKVLLSENCDFKFQKDLMELAQIVSFEINPSYDYRVQNYLTVYAINGCLSVLQNWLNEGMLDSPTKISNILLQVLYKGIISFK